ncbi:MAG TPA: protocatechuate 3,4-dioxygenase subunit alpha [Acidiphilium sp.]
MTIDNQNPEVFGQTPSQTVGPFFHYGLPWKGGADLVGASALGARPDLFPSAHDMLNTAVSHETPHGEIIEIAGFVFDGAGRGVPDAMVEIWQANAAGRYAAPGDARDEVPLDPGFIGFGRSATSAEGEYRFRTVRPGRVPGPGNTLQAPHIAVSVFGRGLLRRLATRLYFADGAGNDTDPVLARVPEARRGTLIARRDADRIWRLDIVLQGERETVFFDL